MTIKDIFKKKIIVRDITKFQNAYVNMTIAYSAALLALHVGVAASVIPYVYVNDSMANCGARVILEEFGSDVYKIASVLFISLLFGGIDLGYRFVSYLVRGGRIEIFADIIVSSMLTIFIILSIYIQIYISIRDATFLANPPVLEPHSDRCPTVRWANEPLGNKQSELEAAHNDSENSQLLEINCGHEGWETLKNSMLKSPIIFAAQQNVAPEKPPKKR
jgi:hypothetical protein